jgi:hypothetical protein
MACKVERLGFTNILEYLTLVAKGWVRGNKCNFSADRVAVSWKIFEVGIERRMGFDCRCDSIVEAEE